MRAKNPFTSGETSAASAFDGHSVRDRFLSVGGDDRRLPVGDRRGMRRRLRLPRRTLRPVRIGDDGHGSAKPRYTARARVMAVRSASARLPISRSMR